MGPEKRGENSEDSQAPQSCLKAEAPTWKPTFQSILPQQHSNCPVPASSTPGGAQAQRHSSRRSSADGRRDVTERRLCSVAACASLQPLVCPPGPDPRPTSALPECDSKSLPNTPSPRPFGALHTVAANQRGKQVSSMPITRPSDRCLHLLRHDGSATVAALGERRAVRAEV